MTPENAEIPLPDFVQWPIFPFIGDMQVRPVEPRHAVSGPNATSEGRRRRRYRCSGGSRRKSSASPGWFAELRP
jgi:hypothetical protein